MWGSIIGVIIRGDRGDSRSSDYDPNIVSSLHVLM